jgi:5-methylcytosine-specific restriction enzyme subunit McrC
MIWSIAEFEGVYSSEAASDASEPIGLTRIPQKHLAALKDLIAAQPQQGDADDAAAVLSLSHRRGIGDVVSSRNYVGTISFANGDQIEILPKLARTFKRDSDKEKERLRAILLKMLRAAFDLDAKSVSESDQRLARLPVLEAFFKVFLACVSDIVRHGLAGGYSRMEGNEPFFKGKLLVAQHLHENIVRRDRFFVAYDSFRSDTPANRLLRSGLDFVLAHSASDENKVAAHRLVAAFEDVPVSANLAADFAACTPPPRDIRYREALVWCGVFLRGHSLANLPGTKCAQAFLFPMEALFERYVAKSLRQAATPDIRVVAQSKDIWLRSTVPVDSLVIQPDILLRRDDDDAILAVMDTKWKLLDSSRPHSGVSQADFYQLAAYQRHHEAAVAVLVYPWHSALGELSFAQPLYLHETESPRIRIAFFDVASPAEAAKSLLATAK